MEAADSAAAFMETGAPVPCRNEITGGEVCRLRMISTTSTVHKSLSLAEKRWKGDNVAKEMLTRCAEDAAVRATAEVKDITSRLMRDAAERDQLQAEREMKK